MPFSALFRDPDIERPLELDPARDVDEQAVRPERRVVGGELLVPADERVEPRVILGERLDGDSVRDAGDLDPVLPDLDEPGPLDIDQLRPRRGRALARP